MQMTMRWFGPQEDKIPLEYIRQVPGVEGVVGALYDVAPGEVWPVEKIKALVEQAHAAGLKMEVIESVNIHDDIKIGTPERDRYIENYKQTIRNLAGFGIKVICYNFMPVFDWMKTDMISPATPVLTQAASIFYFPHGESLCHVRNLPRCV